MLGALPVYIQVAQRSYAGLGSIALLENLLLSGWKGKALVLVRLGFAATDFVITMTLSGADAARGGRAGSGARRASSGEPADSTLTRAGGL